MSAARLILVEGMIGAGKTTTAGWVEDWLSPWARHRVLRGPGAVAALYQAWEAFVDVLYDRYPFPKLMVTDPQHDWPTALARIGAALRP